MVESLRRVFAAVDPSPEARLALVDRLSGIDIPGKVVAPENWHMTLRFLGHLDEVTYERFLGALSSTDLGPGFKIALGGLGAFPRARNATVMWVGVEQGSDELEELAAVAEEAAQQAGLPAEDRPFRPHLTLSRIRPSRDVRDLIENDEPVRISWRCDSLVVYQSHQGGGGVRYEPLETLPLGR